MPVDLSQLTGIHDPRERLALRGLFASLPTEVTEVFSLGTPALAVANLLVKAATTTSLPNNSTKTYDAATAGEAAPFDGGATTTSIQVNGSAVTVWDLRQGATYGRNLVSVMTHSSAVVASTVTLTGYDWLGQPMSELFTHSAGGTSKSVTGKKAFAYVKTIVIVSAGNATTNTLNLGTGSAIGLPYRLEKIGHVGAASLGGVQELINVASNATVVAAVATSPATVSTGDVRGTITFTGTLDGAVEAFIHYYVSGRWTKPVALHGVAQV